MLLYGSNRYSKNIFVQAAIAAIMETAVELEKEDHVAAEATGLSMPDGRNIYGYTKAGGEMHVQTREEDIRAELKRKGGQTVLFIWHESWGEKGKVDSRLIEPAVAKLREKYPQLDDTRGRLILSTIIRYSYCVLMRESRDQRVRSRALAMIKRVRHKLEDLIRSPFEQSKDKGRRSQNGTSQKGGQRKPRRQRPRRDRQRKDRPANTPMSKQRPASSGGLNLDFLKDFGKKKASPKLEAAPADTAIIETKVGETHPVDVVAESGEDEERPFALDKRPGERHSAPVLEEHKDLSTGELLKIYVPGVVYPFTRKRTAKAKLMAMNSAAA